MPIVKENLFVNSTAKVVFDKLKEVDTIPLFLEFIKVYSDKTAIVDGKEYTFSDLDKRIGQIRAALKENGVKQGDAVGVLFPNSFEFTASSLAVMSYGAIAVLFPYQLDDKSIFGCSMKYALTAILYEGSASNKVAFTAEKNPAVKLICTDCLSEGYENAVDVEPKSGAAVVFTAGTTGQSKGALLSHKALTVGMRNGCYGYGDALCQKYFLLLPLTHIFGLVRNLLTALYTGSSLYICRNLKDMFREMPVYKPTLLVMVPALAELALNMTKMMGPQILGGELKTIIAGAAVVSPYLAQEYDHLGVTLCAGYGLTETANLVSGNPETLKFPESVGLLYPGQEYKIVDDELWIKGDNVLTEYYRDAEATAAAFEDGFFKTGDLVRFDQDGRLYITGRCKDIIVLATGENISPAELETRFCELECIQDALVYLEKNGNNETLVVEALPRMTILKQEGVEDVNAYCTAKLKEVNSTLYDYQKVNKIVIRTEDFARTPSMKIIRPKNV